MLYKDFLYLIRPYAVSSGLDYVVETSMEPVISVLVPPRRISGVVIAVPPDIFVFFLIIKI